VDFCMNGMQYTLFGSIRYFAPLSDRQYARFLTPSEKEVILAIALVLLP